MSDGDHDGLLVVRDEGYVVGKSRQVHASVARRAQPPKQRVLNNRRTYTFDLSAKPHTEASRAGLVITRDTLDLRGRFREET